jgi:hypothetical protein
VTRGDVFTGDPTRVNDAFIVCGMQTQRGYLSIARATPLTDAEGDRIFSQQGLGDVDALVQLVGEGFRDGFIVTLTEGTDTRSEPFFVALIDSSDKVTINKHNPEMSDLTVKELLKIAYLETARPSRN